ncbi:MAG: response regulator [Elusimicrobiaceae bacterium]|jgi:CheY-like chemotaxis protein
MQKILVVDDDQTILKLLVDVLSVAGFEVFTAEDAVSAVAEYVKNKPALMLVDFEIPAGGGDTVVRRLRGEMGQKIPIVIVSGHEENTIGVILKFYKVSFLKKPFSREKLLAAVGSALELELNELLSRREANDSLKPGSLLNPVVNPPIKVESADTSAPRGGLFSIIKNKLQADKASAAAPRPAPALEIHKVVHAIPEESAEPALNVDGQLKPILPQKPEAPPAPTPAVPEQAPAPEGPGKKPDLPFKSFWSNEKK